MGTIQRPGAGRNPRDSVQAQGFPARINCLQSLPRVRKHIAYYHTVEAFKRTSPTREQRQRLFKAQKGYVKIEVSLDNDGQICGCRICANHPTVEFIRALNEMQQDDETVVLSRHDLAHDVICATVEDNREFSRAIGKHAVILNVRSNGREQEGEWARWGTSNPRRSMRRREKEFVSYPDRDSKWGPFRCAHFELRAYNAAGIRRKGIDHCAQLIDTDITDHMNRHVRLFDYPDIGWVKNKLIKRAGRQYRMEKGKTGQRNYQTQFTERYDANAGRRLIAWVNRHAQDTAQWVHDHCPIGWTTPSDVQLEYPRTLTWPSSSSSMKSLSSVPSHRHRYRVTRIIDNTRHSQQRVGYVEFSQ